MNQDRINNLVMYVQGLLDQESGKELYLKYKSDIEKVTPQEAFAIFHKQLERGFEPSDILTVLDKVINIFYKSLSAYQWKKPGKDSFMDLLMQENHALTLKLEAIKEIIKEKDFQGAREIMTEKISELQGFNSHYLKKENILFPFMEKKAERFGGLSIMWALHDETRDRIEKTVKCLENPRCEEAEFNYEIGRLFFAMYGLVQKEELILFPAASELIDDVEWKEMQRQSKDYGYAFMEGPGEEAEVPVIPGDMDGLASAFSQGYQFITETGTLGFEQILMIFNTLPVDITFVDEYNKVRFFNRPKDRMFPRSPAIIGRDVEKCHPPESVHVVRSIIDAFRNGTRDTASFWINIKGKMLLIQYFALRDNKGEFRGTLEVSQDITGIKTLEGERRLLHWEQ